MTSRSRSSSLVHQPHETRTSPRPGSSRTSTPASWSRADDGRRLLLRPERDERRADGRGHEVDARPQELPAALRDGRGVLERPLGTQRERGEHRAQRSLRPPAGLEAARTRLRVVRAVRGISHLREVARRRNRQPLGVTHDERSRGIRPAEPLLPGDREEVDSVERRRDGAHRLGAVRQHRHAAPLPQLRKREDGSGRPQHLRGRDQPRPRRDGREDRVRVGLRRRPHEPARRRPGRAARNARRSSSRSRPRARGPGRGARSRRPPVVESVRATWAISASTRAANAARASSRSASVSSKYALPLRPRRRSSATAPVSASATGRARGPNVPAFRYATASRTGNSCRASSSVTPPRPRRAPPRRGGRRARRHSARAAPAATRRPGPRGRRARARGRSRSPDGNTRRGPDRRR